MSADYEKLGVFYLGREFDPTASKLTNFRDICIAGRRR